MSRSECSCDCCGLHDAGSTLKVSLAEKRDTGGYERGYGRGGRGRGRGGGGGGYGGGGGSYGGGALASQACICFCQLPCLVPCLSCSLSYTKVLKCFFQIYIFQKYQRVLQQQI